MLLCMLTLPANQTMIVTNLYGREAASTLKHRGLHLDVTQTVLLYDNTSNKIYGTSGTGASFYSRVAMTCGGCMIVVEQTIKCLSDHKNVWGTDVLPITDMCSVCLGKHCNTG